MTVRNRPLTSLAAVLTAVGALGAASCGARPPEAESPPPAAAAASSPSAAPTAVPGNLLVNPGFELGREPWTKMDTVAWGAFEIVDFPVRSGTRSAHLPVLAAADDLKSKVRVYGVLQEPRQQPFPERLSGWYRVETWEPGPPPSDLYVQAVVIVWGDPRTARLVNPGNPQDGITNYQIRYYLAGLEKPPFVLSNARYRFVGRGKPEMGHWVRFEIDLHRDFQELWGTLPEGYEFLRVLFEARWDNRPPGMPLRCDVYYDDLYLGPAAGDPQGPAGIR